MSDLTISGKIIAVFPVKTGVSKTSGKQWSSQQYIIETTDQYPKKCSFEVLGEDKIAEFAIKVGEALDVSLDIDAHEYQGRWYNSIRAWRVVRPAQAQTQAQAQQQTMQEQLAQQRAVQMQPTDFGTNYDQLPF